jgi:4-amino-4-deoxy-L-arabinose transferase-like glycosyltransferase
VRAAKLSLLFGQVHTAARRTPRNCVTRGRGPASNVRRADAILTPWHIPEPRLVAVVAGSIVWATGVFGAYGWFTDELYFLACARRPALGYVDHPPLATLLLTVLRVACDDNLALIRLVPTAAYGAAIALVGSLAKRLDGGALAQTLAAAMFATAPAVLVIAGFYSMNPFELLFAIGLAHVALALTRGAHPRAWLGFGAITGLALLNKHSTLLPAGLLALAALGSPARAHLGTRWPYLAVARPRQRLTAGCDRRRGSRRHGCDGQCSA